jgi:hypothetical protein
MTGPGREHLARGTGRTAALVGVVSVGVALWGGPVAGSEARVIDGTARSDVLRGTQGADVIEGRGGDDRLFGRGGRDRLIGGPGDDRLAGGSGGDRLSCGGGRDTAVVGRRDVLERCEVVKDADGRRVPVGKPGGRGGPAPPGCWYRTEPVLVPRRAAYVVEERVVLRCRRPPDGGGPPVPVPVPTPVPPPGPGGVDTTPPIFAGLTDALACSPGPSAPRYTYTLTWSPASDNVTPSTAIVYDIYQATSPSGEDLARPSYTSAPGVTSYRTPELAPATYHFLVRARDEASNRDANTVERAGRDPCGHPRSSTPGSPQSAVFSGGRFLTLDPPPG